MQPAIPKNCEEWFTVISPRIQFDTPLDAVVSSALHRNSNQWRDERGIYIVWGSALNSQELRTRNIEIVIEIFAWQIYLLGARFSWVDLRDFVLNCVDLWPSNGQSLKVDIGNDGLPTLKGKLWAFNSVWALISNINFWERGPINCSVFGWEFIIFEKLLTPFPQ